MKWAEPKSFAIIFISLVASCLSSVAAAQSFPARPIRIVVPFPGGSVVDTYTRMLAEHMVPALNGQAIIVEPRSGAGTEVGTKYVLSQPADGYTLLMITPAFAVKASLPKPAWDARRDVAVVGGMFDSSQILAIRASLPFKTVKELVDFAKANPGKLNMVNYGVGTQGHLSGELLMYKAGAQAASIPYNGAVAAALALSQGNGDFGFNAASALMPFAQQGKVRLLAASTAQRDPAMPDIPGMAESGIKDFNVASWGGLLAPAGTPKTIVMQLNSAMGAGMKAQPVRMLLKSQGIFLNENVSSPEAFAQEIYATVDEFSQLIRNANLQLE